MNMLVWVIRFGVMCLVEFLQNTKDMSGQHGMETGLIAKRTYDVALVWSVVFQPELWDSITEDDPPLFKPDVINQPWVALYTDESELVGLYNLHPVSQSRSVWVQLRNHSFQFVKNQVFQRPLQYFTT